MLLGKPKELDAKNLLTFELDELPNIKLVVSFVT